MNTADILKETGTSFISFINIADLATIAIIAASVIFGARRGLMRTALGVVSIILSLSLACWAYPFVSDMISGGVIGEKISQSVEAAVSPESETAETEPASDLPSALRQNISKSIDSAAKSAKAAAADSISSLAVNIVSMILVFIIVRILMFFISKALDFVVKLPVLKSVNRIAGGVAGFLCGILIVFIIMTLITLDAAVKKESKMADEIQKSHIASILYENNIITKYIYKS